MSIKEIHEAEQYAQQQVALNHQHAAQAQQQSADVFRYQFMPAGVPVAPPSEELEELRRECGHQQELARVAIEAHAHAIAKIMLLERDARAVKGELGDLRGERDSLRSHVTRLERALDLALRRARR